MTVSYTYVVNGNEYVYAPERCLSEDGMRWILKHRVLREGAFVGLCSYSPYYIGIDSFKEWVDTHYQACSYSTHLWT